MIADCLFFQPEGRLNHFFCFQAVFQAGGGGYSIVAGEGSQGDLTLGWWEGKLRVGAKHGFKLFNQVSIR